MNRFLILVTTLLLGTACSTPYQTEGWTGGYGEKQLNANSWYVTFQGNANRDATFVMNAAMYRAAEIARREGHDYFEVMLPVTAVSSRAYVNFTNLVSYKAELAMKLLRGPGEGCPKGPALGCKVHGTRDALAHYGSLIGVAPPK